MPVTRREEGPVPATLELLVLWRGTPGWFLRPASGGGSVSFEDTVEYPRPGRDTSRPEQARALAGRRRGSTVTIRQGSVLLELRFDPESAIVYVQGHLVRLNEDNVVLVDDVDGPAGPQVAGTLRIDQEVVEGEPAGVRRVQQSGILIVPERLPIERFRVRESVRPWWRERRGPLVVNEGQDTGRGLGLPPAGRRREAGAGDR